MLSKLELLQYTYILSTQNNCTEINFFSVKLFINWLSNFKGEQKNKKTACKQKIKIGNKIYLCFKYMVQVTKII